MKSSKYPIAGGMPAGHHDLTAEKSAILPLLSALGDSTLCIWLEHSFHRPKFSDDWDDAVPTDTRCSVPSLPSVVSRGGRCALHHSVIPSRKHSGNIIRVFFPRKTSHETARSGRRPSHNALAETINGLYKAEVIHRRGPWRSFEAVEYATLEWVDWLFNHRRLLEPNGNIPPAEAEAQYYAMLDDTPLAA